MVHHARAQTYRISLDLEPESPAAIHLAIVDNGLGLPATAPAGVGLASMRERAAELGGTLTIEPAAPAGTRVSARLPLIHEDA